MEALIHCQQCQKVIVAYKTTRKFCSGACRIAHFRGEPAAEASEDDQLEIMVNFLMNRNKDQTVD